MIAKSGFFDFFGFLAFLTFLTYLASLTFLTSLKFENNPDPDPDPHYALVHGALLATLKNIE